MAWNEQEFSATLLRLHGGELVAIGAALSTTLNFLTKCITPIVSHDWCLLPVADVACACAGVTYGCLAGLKGTVMVPEGGDFIFAQALSPRSSIARPPRGAGDMLHVNSFDVKYREDGSVDQFVSDLSVLDGQGRERLRKSISVNDPLRYQVSHRER